MKSGFGIMFHHLHGISHPVGQGSISQIQFDQMIQWLNKRFTLLNIEDFYQKALYNDLKPQEICLTFDDSLLCQFELALPVLETYGIKALFNIYSSAFSDSPSHLEIYRYFRSTCYDNFEDFFSDFCVSLNLFFPSEFKLGFRKYHLEKKIYDAFPFYSESDKLFRYFRDHVLTKNDYNNLMHHMMIQKKFDDLSASKKIFMSESQLIYLHKNKHVLGLHSDTHPTQIQLLPKQLQYQEYVKNYKFLEGLSNTKPRMMAHPCGNYNDNTIQVLTELDIKIGFRSSLSVPYSKTLFEIPREDHTNILKMMAAE